jgi:hypothetical protein
MARIGEASLLRQRQRVSASRALQPLRPEEVAVVVIPVFHLSSVSRAYPPKQSTS